MFQTIKFQKPDMAKLWNAMARKCPQCGGSLKAASNKNLALCRQCEHGAACPPALAAIKEGAGDFPTHCHQCECGHIEPIEAAPGAAIGLRLMRRG